MKFVFIYLVSLPPSDSCNPLLTLSRIVSDGALSVLSPPRHNSNNDTASFLFHSSVLPNALVFSIPLLKIWAMHILSIRVMSIRNSGYDSSPLTKKTRALWIVASFLCRLFIASFSSLNYATNISTFLSRLAFSGSASRPSSSRWQVNSRSATRPLYI